MAFKLPVYHPPDFQSGPSASASPVKTETAPADGIAPDNFHATTNYPEYLHRGEGNWVLVRESRMDCVIVLNNGVPEVVEPRRLRKGDRVVVGRSENGEDGILVHDRGFPPENMTGDKFSFHTRRTRETPFSRSYDQIYDILRHDRDNGFIVWVLGPAVAFDRDSRSCMQGLIENGFCHGIMAGNALATHDMEASHFGTGLGQDIYSQELHPGGHYNHLDMLNQVRKAGSLGKAIRDLKICDGIIYSCEKMGIPFVLAGSIRDDGPLPEVIGDACGSQDEMRRYARKATTVITLATQLHSIAFGNMTPGYRVMENQDVRPVYFYIVDMTEFSADKLANRGSLQAIPILTNVQDFMINLWNNLGKK